MKFPRGFLILCALIIVGAYLGSWLSQQQVVELVDELPVGITVTEVEADVVRSPLVSEDAMQWPVDFPAGAIAGERVLHFESRDDYLAYLKMLAQAGLSPLGTIEGLLVVRIGQDAMVGANPGRYGARGSFSYRVAQPLPPVEVNPELYSRLQAFGLSAQAVVGGLVEGDGSGVLVGILDSGIEAHAHFDDISMERIDLTGSGVSGPGAAHGTAVASIIAGSAGIAPNAELFVVRVLDEEGLGNSFHVAAGIVRAVDAGVDVLNLSLGVYQDTQVLREAVRYAAAQGVLMVAAAGNDGYAQLPYPAAYPQVLAVTAVDAAGRQALFPNQSEVIDFAAPGVGVLTAQEGEGTMLFTGTSAAAPFVTGTLASMLSADGVHSPETVVHVMKRHLDDAGAPGTDPLYGAGVLNWDRLRERDTAGILDVAVADIYLPPDTLPGTTMPVEVIVQNRGTHWLATSTLTVLVGASEPMHFSIGSLGPGKITTRKVYTQVPAIRSEERLDIAAQVLPEAPMDDVRIENNTKAVFFKPMQNE